MSFQIPEALQLSFSRGIPASHLMRVGDPQGQLTAFLHQPVSRDFNPSQTRGQGRHPYSYPFLQLLGEDGRNNFGWHLRQKVLVDYGAGDPKQPPGRDSLFILQDTGKVLPIGFDHDLQHGGVHESEPGVPDLGVKWIIG